MKKYCFFIGGIDAEMLRILEVIAPAVEAGTATYQNNGLGWGAKASEYGTDFIRARMMLGEIPVLVELELDCDIPEGSIVIDHHGERSGEAASLLQVLGLLEIAPTRWDKVVAANDSGWFPGLQAINATPAEMEEIRLADRQAQGITAEMEHEALRALNAPLEMVVGDIRVIRMSHSKTAPIGDSIAIEAITKGKKIPAYLILSDDGEVNFSGNGEVASNLQKRFEGWSGGSGLGDPEGTAFWGGYPNHKEVLDFLGESCK